MKAKPAALFAIFLWTVVSTASAHRLDEYLQATTIAVEKDRVVAQFRLTPGVAVARAVLADIDTNGDGVLSEAETQAYGERVRRDVSLALDGKHLQLGLISSVFPSIAELQEGLGEILLTFESKVPGGGPNRTLLFENHHQSGISAYLVNCLSPSDPDIRIITQDRNYDQSLYRLDYTQGGSPAQRLPAVSAESDGQKIAVRPDRQAVFEGYFYHGIRHILTGYDHLLFVGALVLAATTLWELVKVVSAFTLAHTITLTLAASNLIHLPGRVVEPLISASIVFVAVQNVFRPRGVAGWSRLAAAFFFGFFHGLGFAGGLFDAMRGMPGATMLLAVLAFSVGVETGHQMVVLPLFGFLKLLRRTPRDPAVRAGEPMLIQRIGSTGISVAGVYYLCLALTGDS